MPNRPGLDQGSDQWFNENSAGVPPALLPAIKNICRNYQLLETTDPGILSRLIMAGLGEAKAGIMAVNRTHDIPIQRVLQLAPVNPPPPNDDIELGLEMKEKK